MKKQQQCSKPIWTKLPKRATNWLRTKTAYLKRLVKQLFKHPGAYLRRSLRLPHGEERLLWAESPSIHLKVCFSCFAMTMLSIWSTVNWWSTTFVFQVVGTSTGKVTRRPSCPKETKRKPISCRVLQMHWSISPWKIVMQKPPVTIVGPIQEKGKMLPWERTKFKNIKNKQDHAYTEKMTIWQLRTSMVVRKVEEESTRAAPSWSPKCTEPNKIWLHLTVFVS